MHETEDVNTGTEIAWDNLGLSKFEGGTIIPTANDSDRPNRMATTVIDRLRREMDQQWAYLPGETC